MAEIEGRCFEGRTVTEKVRVTMTHLAAAITRSKLAELSPAEKDEISHRGRAARALLDWLAVRTG